jgi:hypothetical protein
MVMANWRFAFNHMQSLANISSGRSRFGCRLGKSRMTYIREQSV